MKTLHNLLTPPVFKDDEEKTRIARLLNIILITVMALVILFSVPAFLLTPHIGRILIELILAAWSVIMLVILRRGYVRPAAFLLSLTLWVVISYGTYDAGGFRGSMMASYFAIILIAELLIGTKAGITFGALSILFTGWLVYADGAGILPPKAAYATVNTLWGEFSSVVIGMVVILSLVVNSLHDAVERARKKERELALKMQESQKLAAHLAKNYAFLESFIRRIGHEARTPMGAMLGYAELILEGPLTALQKDQAQRIVNNTNALTFLFNGLLDTFQIQSGQLVLSENEYRLDELVLLVQSNHSAMADKKKLLLKIDVDPQMPDVLVGDRLRIGQILSNLVSNAIKFTKIGEVNVRLQKISDMEWKIEVSDTGIGIAEDVQGFIFQPFRQADESTTRRYGGIGLGLSVSYELVTLMGGSISVKSEPGKGSTFTIILPLVTPDETVNAVPIH